MKALLTNYIRLHNFWFRFKFVVMLSDQLTVYNWNNIMNDYLWETEEELLTNSSTMNDYIEYHMPKSWEVLFLDGTYAEIKTDKGLVYEAHVSGNGDFRSHKIEFEFLYCDAA